MTVYDELHCLYGKLAEKDLTIDEIQEIRWQILFLELSIASNLEDFTIDYCN